MAAAGLVAVAAAAEYSGTVASGGNLPGVHCGPSSGAGPGSGPGSWSRSLDRALEEAAVTGVLSLSGRKLREFPRGAANHDLTDTTRAELAELPLIRLDFSCNKITTIPVCYRNLRHLQMITLDNNPLQSPPAQICIKGKVHIFKYLNIQACKIAPDLPDYDRRPLGFGSCHEELYSSRPYGALDSGFNSVDSGDKRWSGNEPTDEFSDLPLRVAEMTKEQRLRRESQYQENRGSLVVTNGGVEHDLDQIDFIDSCTAEEEEAEGSPVKPVAIREFQKTEDMRRYLHQNRVPVEPSSLLSLSASHNQLSHTDLELHRRREQLVERTRREAQLAALQYEEEKIRTKQIQRDAVLDFVKQKASQSPQKQHPLLDGECPFPSRRSQHTDDSALLVSLSGLNQVGRAAPLPHSSAFTPLKSDDRPNTLLSSPTTETVHHSSAYAFPAVIQRNQPQRPESFLFRAGGRAETNKGHASPLPPSAALTTDSTDSITRQNSRQREEELELIDQLRKHIEYRLKVSLPCDLGAALTDGVVLCHLANHVRPRSVPSIHVPSPAVPKLTMAKCRRNVENFLEACRKIGVPQEQLCLPLHILEEKGLSQVAVTVQALLELAPPKQQQHQLSAV
ncbi:PREDICTED: leucine-rich repeat and calponin homology domain-containing protein 3 isoform X6 [Colobus angolensis palliatus]|uniref:Calponin-homology (CH) domain-containing protein n=1 Tax=Colobus angolensis palliatus TaxID=336983 RepID=A0A2K5HS08_COLAP|nr:PREDICTED: leucine-rich repeat and calponin homology domain-containing protein 3 isoform X6 [Colobus angolensis palliatus]